MVKMNSTSSNKCFKITFEVKTGIYGPDWSAHTGLCIWHPTLTRTMSASDDINPLVPSWEPEHDFPLDIVSLPLRIATSFLCTTFNTTIKSRTKSKQFGLLWYLPVANWHRRHMWVLQFVSVGIWLDFGYDTTLNEDALRFYIDIT